MSDSKIDTVRAAVNWRTSTVNRQPKLEVDWPDALDRSGSAQIDPTSRSSIDASAPAGPEPGDVAALIRFRRRGIDVAEAYFAEPDVATLPPVDYLRVLGVHEPHSALPWRLRQTLVVDLSASEDEILGQMSKGTRYEVQRASKRDALAADVYETPDGATLAAFVAYYGDFARSRSLAPAFRPRLEAMAAAGMLVLSRVTREGDDTALAWHAYAAAGRRALLMHSASRFREASDSAERNLVGRANRLLHWHDMLRFKERGVPDYDLGGVDVAQRDPATARIAAFKKGFGGQLRDTHACSTARSPKGRLVQAAMRLRRIDF